VSTRRLVTATVLAAIVVSGLASCGLPQDREPQRIAGALPENLRVRGSTSTTGPSRSEKMMLYFVKAGDGADATDMLVPIAVNVSVPANPADLPRAVLDELLLGTTADERGENLSSDIPANTQVNNVARSGDTVTVDLNNLNKVEGKSLQAAVAQIVFTLTGLPEIRQVQFLSNGQPSAVPLDGGSSDPTQAVGRSSFPKFQQGIADDQPGAAESTTTTADPTAGSVLQRP